MGIPGVVSAAGELGTADMVEGTTAKASTEIIMDKGAVSFTDKSSGLSASTTTTINGVAFVPAKTTEGKELEWTTGETNIFLQPDPVVKMVYSYDGKTLKEIITLKEDRVLTFPITLSTYSKLIPWYNGQWKIVASNSFNTMDGIVLEKPYGIDANGKRIEMEYTYDKGVLTLVYNRVVTEWEAVEKEVIVIDNKTGLERTEIEVIYVPKYSPITYPLAIDPTWVAIDGHWIDSTSNATHTVEMWNATGTVNWTPPAGVTSAEYLVVAGGGAGGGGEYTSGGGGAGGYKTGTISNLSGAQTVTVGVGGTAGTGIGGNGGNSVFGSNTSTGGGGGATGSSPYNQPGAAGGSGGGGGYNAASGGAASPPGQGNAGGSSLGAGGGGGGAGSTGYTGSISDGSKGGVGLSSSITGNLVCYAGGGAGSVWGNANATATCGGGYGRWADNSHMTAGTDGLGGGGGGGGDDDAGPPTAGANGGSGIVIIKYLTPAGPPVPSFTSNVVSGYAPQAVQFNDTSITTPTAWNWSYANTTPGNGTQIWWSQVQNATNTFGVGNWDIRLNVTNATGFATTTSPYYVNVSPPFILANFTCSPLALTTSDTLSCVDTSIRGGGATITNWAWTFEDSPTNQTATTQNAAITYTSDGVWDVTHGVYNATTGWNNRTRSNYVSVSASGAFSGFNRQDIMMDQIYTLILNVKDATTLGGVPGATIMTSNGDNLTTSVLGVATISTNYTALVVQVGASGYLSRTISYVVDRDRTETIYLTPIVVVPTAVPNTNILYTPKQIELTVVSYDPAGVVVKNASVTLAAVANTLQADSQLETLYGINPIAANQLMNGTLLMHGLSDSSGGIVFTILQSINYKATVIDPRDGKTYIAMLYPGMDPYTIWIGTSPLAVNTTANTYLNTTKLFVTQPDVANITMNMQYQNKLGTTTSVVFTVKYQNNLTTAYQTTIAGFGTSMVYANYTVPNVRGQGYFYLYNATRTT